MKCFCNACLIDNKKINEDNTAMIDHCNMEELSTLLYNSITRRHN